MKFISFVIVLAVTAAEMTLAMPTYDEIENYDDLPVYDYDYDTDASLGYDYAMYPYYDEDGNLAYAYLLNYDYGDGDGYNYGDYVGGEVDYYAYEASDYAY